MSADEVVAQIRRLHGAAGPQAIPAASQWLTNWADNQAEYTTLFNLLSTSDELCMYYAANVLAQKAQRGRSASPEVAQQVLKYMMQCPMKVAKRQLAVAYADLSLYGHSTLEAAITVLQGDASQYETLLELLRMFPEEIRSSKINISQDERIKKVGQLLSFQEQVFDALITNPTHITLKLQACEQWLMLPTPDVIAAKEAQTSFTSHLIKRRCYDHRLLLCAAESLLDPNDVSKADAACGVLIALLSLTNECTNQSHPALKFCATAVIQLARNLAPEVNIDVWLPSGPTSPDADPHIQRLNIVTKLLSDLGAHFYRALGTPMAEEWTAQLADVALHWLTIRSVDLARGGLDFWYGVLALAQSDNWGKKKLLHPWMEKFTHGVIKAVRYPSDPESQEGFEIDSFVRFREHCNQCLTESVATVLPVTWVIALIGSMIENNEPTWNELDAAIFILTAVAPRAPAGQDTVLPKLIDFIPKFPYPNVGVPALLLRVAAGRLILYTAGYLALEEQTLVQTLKFLIHELLPSLPHIECDNKELKQFAQSHSVDALRVVTQSSKEVIMNIHLGDGSDFWKEVVQQLINLILTPTFHPDVRAQIVFSVGHIFCAMRDYELLEEALENFAKQLEPKMNLRAVPQNSDNKGPCEMKLYLAALSSAYDVKVAQKDRQLLQRHPVLHVWEKHWHEIEELVKIAVEKEWEDFLEQFCMSLNYIFTCMKRDQILAFAAKSSVFPKSMNLLCQAAQHKPLVHYYSLVRGIMGLFAWLGSADVDEQLVNWLGQFALPIAQRAKAKTVSPEIAASAFEMMGDALRWSNLANGSLRSQWLPEVFDCAVHLLQQPSELATHEHVISNVLRFFCSFLRWATEWPDVVALSKPLWEGEARVKLLVDACIRLLALCAENPRSLVVIALADVLRPMLMGPMEFETRAALKTGFVELPPPLGRTPMDSQKIVETLCIQKIDSRRFGKQVYDLVEHFHNTLKRSGS